MTTREAVANAFKRGWLSYREEPEKAQRKPRPKLSKEERLQKAREYQRRRRREHGDEVRAYAREYSRAWRRARAERRSQQ